MLYMLLVLINSIAQQCFFKWYCPESLLKSTVDKYGYIL